MHIPELIGQAEGAALDQRDHAGATLDEDGWAGVENTHARPLGNWCVRTEVDTRRRVRRTAGRSAGSVAVSITRR
ncbi:hypothetical protein JMUB6875_12480 [Nocardia sp. JMUB6875]